jgi:hypothetical protein
MMEHIGLNPERLRLEWVSAGEGIRFAGIMNEFVPTIEKLGPLGKSEGLDERDLKAKLEAVAKLIPYIKLVLSERLTVPERTEEAYHTFFASDVFERLFHELIANPLARYSCVPAKTRTPKALDVDNKKIDRVIEKHESKARSLVQVLLEIQQEFQWLPQEVLDRVCKSLDVPMSRIMHIVTFHKTFSLIPKGSQD